MYSEEDGSYGGGSVKGDVVVAVVATAVAAAAAAVEPFVRVFPDLLILGKAAVFSTDHGFPSYIVVKSAFCRG